MNRLIPETLVDKTALRHKLELPPSTTIVTYAGHLSSNKGLPLLLRVWNEILRRHKNACLLLVGPGGTELNNCEPDLKEFVQACRLDEHVLFTGNVPNVSDYLRASDIFVFPVENDAIDIHLHLIEAMASGLPVIATPLGRTKDLIRQGHNGLLVNVGDFQQLYYALDVLISHPTSAARLGYAARTNIQQDSTLYRRDQK